MSKRARLIEKFRTVAGERIAKLNNAIVALENDSSDRDAAERATREIHTLKGEAKLLGFTALGRIAHDVEELMLRAKSEGYRRDSAVLELVLGGLDLMEGLRTMELDDPAAAAEADAFCGRAALLFGADVPTAQTLPAPGGEGRASAPSIADVPRATPAAARPAEPPSRAERQAPDTPRSPRAEPSAPGRERTADDKGEGRGSRTTDRGRRAAKADAAGRDTGQETSVRIALSKLDLLADTADELLLAHGVTGRWVDALGRVEAESEQVLIDLRRLMSKLGTHDSRLDVSELRGIVTSMRNRQELVRKELKNALQRLDDGAAASRTRLETLETQVRDLRLLPLASLFEHYPRAIRDMAKAQGKQVKLELAGAGVEVDKFVLDRIEQPLLHLIRNSVDHGAETVSERAAVGKSETATLRLSANQVGSRVHISVSDDGRGVNARELKELAVRRGLIPPDEAAALDERGALELLFIPGFTTREQATDLSGRGVGLDVVKAEVEALGGAVTLRSTPGQGTRCDLVVPVSVVRAPTLMFQVGAGRYGVASAHARAVALVDPKHLLRAGPGHAFHFEGELLPLYWMAKLLQIHAQPLDAGALLPVVILEQGARSAGFVVTRVLEEQQVIQRELASFVEGCRLTNGTAVAGDGELVILLNVAELFRSMRRAGAGIADTAPAVPAAAARRVILIVDDSELTRDMMMNLVSQTGHDVIEAVDGRDALQRTAARTPDLIITDLEMPIMDGFELLAELRASPRYQNVPVVVCSTRGSEEDKRRAAHLGADAYVVKARFNEDELLGVVNRFLERSRG